MITEHAHTSGPNVRRHARRLAAVGIGFVMAVAPISPRVGAHDSARAPIIALGDSIPYGYDPNLAAHGEFAAMEGYPEVVARRGDRRVFNVSCPGQTAQAMVFFDGADFLCPHFLAAGGPLRWNYNGTQLDAAVELLAEHPDTALVTINAGGNDFARCSTVQPDAVVSCTEDSFPAVHHALTTAIQRLRATGYDGAIVLTTYYPFAGSFAAANPLLLLLRDVVLEVADATGALVADSWALFERAASRHGGDTCAAGLLIRLADGSCDIHPSAMGDLLLAGSVHAALARLD